MSFMNIKYGNIRPEIVP